MGGAQIAYQVVGAGSPTYLGTPGLAQNIEILWEEPRAARFLRRHASFSRLIWFDKRGTGLSARGLPSSFAERIDDMRAVMDAEDVDKAFIGGYSDGASMSLLFAATYPERTSGLVIASSPASWTRRDDLPWLKRLVRSGGSGRRPGVRGDSLSSCSRPA